MEGERSGGAATPTLRSVCSESRDRALTGEPSLPKGFGKRSISMPALVTSIGDINVSRVSEHIMLELGTHLRIGEYKIPLRAKEVTG